MNLVPDIAAWPRPSVRLEPSQLTPGERGRIVVTLDIPGGCHIQSHSPKEPFLIPTTFELTETRDLRFGPAVFPPAHVERLEWTPVELDVYRGTVEIVVPVEVSPTATPGPATVAGRLRYQGCTDTSCLPPVDEPIEARMFVQEDSVVSAPG